MPNYLTPKELAEKAEELMNEAGDSRADVASRLAQDLSGVSHALNSPSTRRMKTLAKILSLYDWYVDPKKPAYPVKPPEGNDE